MSGPHRNPDKLNTIGIVVVGICGAVLVYVTIVALQAFYMNDTSDMQTTADYGGQDTTSKTLRADQMRNINDYGANAGTAGTYHLQIDRAMELVLDAAKRGDAIYVPAYGAAKCRTTAAIPGRGHPDTSPIVEGCPGAGTTPAAPAPGPGSGSAAGSGAEPGAGSGSAATSGSAAAPAGGHAR